MFFPELFSLKHQGNIALKFPCQFVLVHPSFSELTRKHHKNDEIRAGYITRVVIGRLENQELTCFTKIEPSGSFSS